MTFKTTLNLLFMISFLMGINSCKQSNSDPGSTIRIFNFDNKKELSEYNMLNLDESHPNLLKPQISKSDYNLVISSWTDLHQNIGKYLSENKFDWEVEDPSITIIHKIYFDRNGEIKNYFFNVLNENVTKEKKEQFANLILTFSKDNQIKIKREDTFAQCGKTKYLNE